MSVMRIKGSVFGYYWYWVVGDENLFFLSPEELWWFKALVDQARKVENYRDI